ncbi:MAG: hypothetical protein LBT10_09555 [Methanobrevibacter sp.]|nr:hypothetical protein [Methanobrevibacter sp.]
MLSLSVNCSKVNVGDNGHLIRVMLSLYTYFHILLFFFKVLIYQLNSLLPHYIG